MASRVPRLAIVLVLVAAAGLAAQAKQTGDDRLKPEAAATCWDCHRVVQGDCGPLQTFVSLVPADGAGATPGSGFAFNVQAQNSWCAEFYSVRVNLDLTNAPSLGFASGVEPVDQVIDDAIPLDLQRPTEPQRSQPIVVEVPAGEQTMDVRLRPASGVTGSDLALLVYPPGADTDGAPVVTRDEGGAGEEEAFAIQDREQFAQLGYGRWTFFAQTQVVSPSGSVVVPSTTQSVPFQLEVNAKAESAEARIGSLATASPLQPVPEAAAASLTFDLVSLALPGPGETVGLSADVWPHYFHNNNRPAEDDDENVTKVHPVAIPVVDEGGQAVVRSGAAPRTDVALPHNGPTLATASEAVGYATAFLLVSSVGTGGMFGKASRRALNHVFGAAKRRVAFHNFLSYGILLAAAVHTTLFVVEVAYHWTLGLIWGGLAVVALLGLGVTGAIQVPLIRTWGYASWRWTHYGLAWAAIVFTIVHVLLDGAHFSNVQDALSWRDPLAPDAPPA